MAEYIKNQEIINATSIRFALDSIIRDLVTLSLEKVIINDHKDVSSFFERYFLGRNGEINSNNKILKNVDPALDIFYQNNKCFPSSLSALNLNITNLGAIYKGLISDRKKGSKEFFYDAIITKNSCMHSDQIPNQEFKNKCNELREIVELCPHVDDSEKQIYLVKLNYILENLVISDAQSTNKAENVEEYRTLKQNEAKIPKQMIQEMDNKDLDQGVMQMIQQMMNKITFLDSQLRQNEKRFEKNENAIKFHQSERR